MKDSVKNLPLSWCIQKESSKLKSIRINIKDIEWICLESFNDVQSFIEEIISVYKNKKTLIRGINEELSCLLQKYNFRKYLIGSEAVIKLDGELEWKKSLTALCKRGQKHTKVIECKYSKETALKLKNFSKLTRHSSKPQLKYLFITEFQPNLRLFVAIDNRKNWQGAILISLNSEFSYHTELLLKRDGAPIGIMENLIVSIARILQEEKCQEYSLGEVPFANTNFDHFPMGKLLNKVKLQVPRFYNYRGLFFFKNKFSPDWRDIYVCTNFRLSIFHILLMAKKTNMLKLLFYKIFNVMDYWGHK